MSYIANPYRYNKMEYRRCGESGLKLPVLSLGLWHNFGHVDNFENGRNILRLAFDRELLILIWQTITGLLLVVLKKILAG